MRDYKTKYLSFELVYIEGRKTPIVYISNRLTNEVLGVIKWIGRGYWFIPENGMRFDKTCMNDIIECIDKLKRKEKSENLFEKLLRGEFDEQENEEG